ncbi:MAG: histidinol-phosphatase [Alphaproteobacteria bacterium]|nr:histidinol-phosphatase [Alphaproteobacteria bacterium]
MRKAEIESALALAVKAARSPSAELVAAFRSGTVTAKRKPDRSFVTKHDLAAEVAIRGILRSSNRFGAFDVEGEEVGRDGRPSPYRWLIDPIDGTTSFLRGIPNFGTIVALEEAETRRAVLGAIHLPMQGETYVAGRGLGAWCGSRRLRVSRCASLADALVSVPDARSVQLAQLEGGYRRLRRLCPQLRGYADCWAHTLAVRGAIDALIEPWTHAWDIRATQVLIEEAGGLGLVRNSPVKGAFDAIFGARKIVEQIAETVDFLTRAIGQFSRLPTQR